MDVPVVFPSSGPIFPQRFRSCLTTIVYDGRAPGVAAWNDTLYLPKEEDSPMADDKCTDVGGGDTLMAVLMGAALKQRGIEIPDDRLSAALQDTKGCESCQYGCKYAIIF